MEITFTPQGLIILGIVIGAVSTAIGGALITWITNK